MSIGYKLMRPLIKKKWTHKRKKRERTRLPQTNHTSHHHHHHQVEHTQTSKNVQFVRVDNGGRKEIICSRSVVVSKRMALVECICVW